MWIGFVIIKGKLVFVYVKIKGILRWLVVFIILCLGEYFLIVLMVFLMFFLLLLMVKYMLSGWI